MKTMEVTPEEEQLILKNRNSPTAYRVGYLKQNLYQYDEEIMWDILSTDVGLMTLDQIASAKKIFDSSFVLAIPTGAKFTSVLESTGDEIWTPADIKHLKYIEEAYNDFSDTYLENISEV